MIVFGIDPGKKLGVARVKIDRCITVIETATLSDVRELGEHIPLVQLFAIEGWEYQGGKRARGVTHQAEAYGKVSGYLIFTDTPQITVTRGQVLSGLNLSRSADKARVKQTIRALTDGAVPSNDHEADAVATAIVGAARYAAASKGVPCAQRSRRSTRPTTGIR